jgi:uncharacterized protein YcbX
MNGESQATVGELWRYPVKSMGGERIDAADVTDAGFAGDRGYAVVDPATTKVGSAKHPRLWGALLQCRARYVDAPRVGASLPPVAITLPDGSETGSDDPEVNDRLSALFGRPVQLTTVAPEGNGYLAVWPEIDGVIPDDMRAQTRVDGNEAEGTLTDMALGMAAPGTFFDVAALHVLTNATLHRLGELEPRSRFAVERYRPNIVIDATYEPFAENDWSGAGMTFTGGLGATVMIPTMRCIMTTLAQGDLPRDNEVLRTLTRHNRIEIVGLGTWSCVGAYATVSAPGRVQVGDEVEVAAAPTA